MNSYYDAIRAIVVMMMTHAEEYIYACTRPTHDEWDEVRYTRPRMGRGTMRESEGVEWGRRMRPNEEKMRGAAGRGIHGGR